MGGVGSNDVERHVVRPRDAWQEIERPVLLATGCHEDRHDVRGWIGILGEADQPESELVRESAPRSVERFGKLDGGECGWFGH